MRLGLVRAAIGCAIVVAGALQPSDTARAFRLRDRVALPPAATTGAVAQSRQPLDNRVDSAEAAAALVRRYCVTCHGGRSPAANLALDTVDVADTAAHADRWEMVVAKLRMGAMPPPGAPRPAAPLLSSFTSWLEESLDRDAEANPKPGRMPPHRLNRLEYTNAVRDLLALDIDGRALLPADDSGYGFDNIADVLGLSPALLERYMNASWQISRLAMGDSSIRREAKLYTVRPTYLQEGRASDDLPFGTRGGLSLRHYFPVDAEYVIKIRLQRTHTYAIRGISDRNQVELRLDRTHVQTFSVGGEGPVAPWAAVTQSTAYERTADDHLEVRLPIKAGSHAISVALIPIGRIAEGVLEPRLSVATYEYAGDRDVSMGVHTVEIAGPFDATPAAESPSRQRILVCTPARPADEEPCANKILTTLARRAFRRPVSSDDVQLLLDVYRKARAEGRFEDGIRLALRAVLVDPAFLFRVESDSAGIPTGTLHPVNQFDLASRLSFFLWSSIPDDRLLDLAERTALADHDVLRREVLRMLDDPRADTLVTNFASQWLHLRNLKTLTPDPQAFPEFDENLREALLQETELFLRDQLRANRSVVDLVTADYTFVNERLARHYGISGVYGNRFRRVTFSDDRRGGLLAHGSILAVTSYANRTSPTIRGKWLLENLLAAPPPPPPPNIPALAERDEGQGANRSVRQRLEEHRRNPVCASCHAPMDPMGLALENFDAIGRWRTLDGDDLIDASATLPDGFVLDGPAGVRRLLLSRRDRLIEAVSEKLLTYALGRGTEHFDGPAVRKIARDAAASDHRWQSLILGVVNSTPFQMRRSASP